MINMVNISNKEIEGIRRSLQSTARFLAGMAVFSEGKVREALHEEISSLGYADEVLRRKVESASSSDLDDDARRAFENINQNVEKELSASSQKRTSIEDNDDNPFAREL